MRRHALEHHGGGTQIIQIGWDRDQPRGGNDRVLGVAAANLRPGHALADARSRHVGAHRDDHAGAFVAGNEWQLAGVMAGALVVVDEVDARRVDAHEGLARAGARHGQRFQFEHLGAAEARDLKCAVVVRNHKKRNKEEGEK